ncbi:FeoB-associated Cys-rich membrane protein [Tannockella kyphosi]|uniref:FeoB-associated Cys-rich membrane protein n=1 Tax=Tannockella kyphosi TaxID=2899121 RepID=UPI002010E65D|nr:FeoB-associated Cys-rich membrane protein [Tannockella kyphosi]
MINIIVILILTVVIGLPIAYLVRAKKNGIACVGCGASGTCKGSCHDEPSKSLHDLYYDK